MVSVASVDSIIAVLAGRAPDNWIVLTTASSKLGPPTGDWFFIGSILVLEWVL